jgi:hypothetical protein
MNAGGFSKARLGRLRAVIAGYVERGEMPGLVPDEWLAGDFSRFAEAGE